jgi:5'(3')-deoxyribonucleotidase
MAVIGISLNEVLRDFIGQFVYTYNKYIGESTIKENEVTNFNLLEHFKFNSKDELNNFMYLESPLEIFGHADQISEGLMGHFNSFLNDIKDDEEHEIILVSKEADKSIPATFFFLSKTGCKIDKINFVVSPNNEWDNLDVLITANPIALSNKPSGKISIKVNASYNKNSSADYTIDNLLVFMKDKSLREQILKNKITNYEEI